MRSFALVLDTNVWHEYAMGDSPEHRSADLILFAINNGVRLGIAAHSMKDLFRLLERDMKQTCNDALPNGAGSPGPAARAVAWGVLERLLENAEVVGSDYMDALKAMKYRNMHDFYEDNLVVSACQRMNADALVTNDKKLLRHSPVNAMTPADALMWLQAEL